MKTNPNDFVYFRDEKDRKTFADGLTKREYFAAMAMQGLCACSIPGSHKMPKRLVVEALEYADALIEELNYEPND